MAEISVLLSFPPDDVASLTPKKYDDAINKYLKSLEKVSGTTWTKPVDKKNLLEMLNPEVNTIPYLVSLWDQVRAADNDKNKLQPLVDYAIIFFANFDPVQARYMGEHWLKLLDWLLDTIPTFGSRDLSPITAAMLRLDPTAGTFTSTHLRLVRKCLDCGVPSHALPILDKNIYALPTTPPKSVPDDLLCEPTELSNTFITPKSSFTLKLHPEYLLEYYLLGAHIYIGTRNHARARLFLEYVILTPTVQHSISAMQVEAYKKWLLVGLPAEGKAYPLPRTHDSAVMKNIKAMSKPYEALAENLEKRDWRKFMAEMDVGTQIWHEDGNLRLVKEVGDALLRFRVIDLQKTYAALPVSRVAAHVGFAPERTLHMITEMIRSRYLNASLTPSDTGAAVAAVLRFHSDALPSSTSAQATDDALAAQTARIEDLVTFVRDADRRLQLTKEYVEYTKRQKRTGPDADLADQMDLSWDNGGALGGPGGVGFGMGGAIVSEDGDEDIMGA